MAIYRIFRERPFHPEAIARLSAAYECALKALGLVDRQDPLTELVARKIIDVAETGEADPDRICDRALEQLGLSPHPYHRGTPSNWLASRLQGLFFKRPDVNRAGPSLGERTRS
jgi:hypothetical protein